MRVWRKPWFVPVATGFGGVLVGILGTVALGKEASELSGRLSSKMNRTLDRIRPSAAPGLDGWVTEDGYKQEIHANGLSYPSRLAFVPTPGSEPTSNFYYVAELAGAIRVVTRNGAVHNVATGLLNFKWKPMDELGIIGLDIDPAGDRLYIALTYWDAQGAVYRNRVDSLALAADGRSVTARTTLLDIKDESTVASYQIQFVEVGPDDHLYVGIGYGSRGEDAQNLDRFAGKVLRMDKSGTAPSDNPFYDAARANRARSYVYALGFRNPFDIDWDPDKKAPIVSDVGPDLDRIVRLDRGANYCFGGGVEGTDMMRANALYTWGPGGSYAPTGLAIVPNEAVGLGAGRSLFVGVFGPVHMPGPNDGKRVSRFAFDPEGRIASGPRIATRYQGQYYSSVADVDLGPDGVYFIELYGKGELPHLGEGRVYRLTRNAQAAPTRDQLALNASPAELFETTGCIACHDLKAGPSRKEGPPLADLADRLETRLNSAEYTNLLNELSRREGEYFAKQRPNYVSLLGTSGKGRVKLWFKLRLMDPRFDDPNAKMPSFAHLQPDTLDKLATLLL